MNDRLAALLRRFELDARVFQAGPLCGSSRFDQGDGLGYLHVLQVGRLQVTGHGHRRLRLDAPAVFFYFNPTSHRLQALQADTRMVCASFEFGAGSGNPLARALPGVVVMPLHELPQLGATLQLLFSEADGDHCGRQAVLDRLIEVVFIQMLRELMDRRLVDHGLLAGLADPRLLKVINALHEAPSRPWTLDGMAAVAGMSRARFAVHFRAVVGTTPAAYLAGWRIGLAQSLLRQGRPLQWVADEVGYGSASALSRAFSAQVGQSPRQWLGGASGG